MKQTARYLSRNRVIQPFHDQELLREVWGDSWGAANEIGRIGKLLMHRPGNEVLQLHDHAREIEAGPVLNDEIKGRSHSDLENTPLPNLEKVISQHEALTKVLLEEGIDIAYLEGKAEGMPERLFTRDLGLVIPGGVILSRLALYLRYGESRLAAQTFGDLGVPILGMVQGTGLAEGGSFMMLDECTAAIGLSERVNHEGAGQIRHILGIQGIELLTVDLPSTIIHLDEAFLMIDHHKALVNTALLPYWFMEELRRRGMELLHVDPKDPPLTINALTVSPGRVVFSSSGVRTMELLNKHGVQVVPVEVDELFKLGGGIHCVTLPLTREGRFF